MKFLKAALLVLCTFFLVQAPAMAQSTADQARLSYASSVKGPFPDTRAIGVGLVLIGAAVGIGWLGRAAVDAMARQPEIAGNAQTAMIIAAALIEGVTFFALIIIMVSLSPY
jgi:F-type H+-transporting ATPase subunit c